MFARLFGSTEKQPEFTPKLVRNIVGDKSILALQALPNGHMASIGKRIEVFDTTMGTSSVICLFSATEKGKVDFYSVSTALQVLPNDSVASGWLDGKIRICDATNWFCIEDRTPVLMGHTRAVFALQSLPDGCLASGSNDRTIRIWDTKTGLCLATLAGHSGSVRALAILPDGHLVSGSDDGTIRIWNTKDESCLGVISAHAEGVSALQVLRDGRLVSASSSDTMIRIWDMRKGRPLSAFKGNEAGVSALHVLADNRLASGGVDGVLRIWDMTTTKCVATLAAHKKKINALQVLPNGFLASGSEDKTIGIWEVSLRQVFLPQPKFLTAPSTPVSTPPTSPSSDNKATTISTAALPILTQAEFEEMTRQIDLLKARPLVSAASLSLELEVLQQRIQAASAQVQPTFSPEEAQRLQTRILVDKQQEALLIERQAILLDPNQSAYYEALQTYISELMVASLGVGSGYVSVNTSQATQVAGWVCEAISSAFPGASLATSVIHSGLTYLDKQYREDFLKKVKALGTNLTEAEVLGEQVARLLVRAHYHAERSVSSQKAAEDAKAMIMEIVKAKPAIVRNENTAHQLVQAVWGRPDYCREPLAVSASNILPASEKAVTSDVATTTVALPSQSMPSQTVSNPVSEFEEQLVEANVIVTANTATTAVMVEDLLRQLAEERALRLKAQQDMARLQDRIENMALKSEVASKKEVAALKQDIAELQGNNNNGDGLILMSRDKQQDKDAEKLHHEQSERRYAHMVSHIEHVSAETQMLIDENARNKERIEELERLLLSTKSLPTTSMFANISMVREGVDSQLAHNSQIENERLKESKRTLFSA